MPTAAAPRRDTAWVLRFVDGAMRGRSVALKAGANVIGAAADGRSPSHVTMRFTRVAAPDGQAVTRSPTALTS